MLETPLSERVAQACLDEYGKLGSRGKPKTRSNGVREWTVLAGIVLVDTSTLEQEGQERLEVLSLGTGLKCLPADRLPLYGDVLHDSHAEIIAKRGFQLWLYEQLATLKTGSQSVSLRYLEPVESDGCSTYRLMQRFKLAMYISTLPCGDASMRYLTLVQDPSVAAQFDDDVPTASSELTRGRRGFGLTGALRTKPGNIKMASRPKADKVTSADEIFCTARADAVTTTSMSCSDKLATYSILGIQGALLSTLLQPVYLSIYVFGGVHSEHREEILVEGKRSLLGRLLNAEVTTPFRMQMASIHFTSRHFGDRKEDDLGRKSASSGCPESLSWVQGCGVEVTSQGVKQGAPVKFGAKQLAKSRSRLCQLCLYRRWYDLVQQLEGNGSPGNGSTTYHNAKLSSRQYQRTKSAIRDGPNTPFASWLRAVDAHLAFTVDSP